MKLKDRICEIGVVLGGILCLPLAPIILIAKALGIGKIVSKPVDVGGEEGFEGRKMSKEVWISIGIYILVGILILSIVIFFQIRGRLKS